MIEIVTISKAKCQICEKHGLTRASEDTVRGRKVVVCQNEYVRHIRVGKKEYLCPARLSEQEEIVGELSLN
jgi:hypothetical protein